MTFHPFSANFSEILDGHFSWQAQYLASLDYDTCCSAHCKARVMCDKDQHLSWQTQYLLKLGADSCCSAHCK